jgi:hypothetical protein
VPGFKTITVSNATYKMIEEYAEKTERSIPKAIKFLVETAKKEELVSVDELIAKGIAKEKEA